MGQDSNTPACEMDLRFTSVPSLLPKVESGDCDKEYHADDGAEDDEVIPHHSASSTSQRSVMKVLMASPDSGVSKVYEWYKWWKALRRTALAHTLRFLVSLWAMQIKRSWTVKRGVSSGRIAVAIAKPTFRFG